MTPPCFIGIDFGTSACRACAIDGAGREIRSAARPLPPPTRPAPGWSEQSPLVWWEALRGVLADILDGLPGSPVAVAVDGTSGTLLAADSAGQPLAAALMYDDTRAAGWSARIREVAPADAPVHSASSSLAKALYLIDSLPAGSGGRLMHQADWVAGQLCGLAGVSDENNALKLGYDPVTRQWPAWLAGLGLPAGCLPRVLPAGAPIGTLSPACADRLGLPTSVLVVAGTTDGTASTLAAGAAAPGDAVTTLGTTLVLKVVSERPVYAPAYGVYSHRVGDLWHVGGASNSGGAVLRQFFADEEIARLSEEIDPDEPCGLDYYPLPRPGERFPVSDPALQPRLDPRPADRRRFLHGLLAGIAAIEALGYRRLAELGAPAPRSVMTAGGGAVNATWRRIRARTLGVPVCVATHTQAAYGAALLARAGSAQSLGSGG
ncbi:MAG: FGGY-family carbohydrate kinase [Gammaproteobacteria bacterium]|nr:FGGY-family carbohydrate kinase [Gammaproteobacteria bacterium]